MRNINIANQGEEKNAINVAIKSDVKRIQSPRNSGEDARMSDRTREEIVQIRMDRVIL